MFKDTKYRFIANNFISNYSANHSRKEVINLLKEVIDKKNVEELPESLKQLDKEKLSLEFSKIVFEHNKYFLPDEREYYVNTILPTVIKQIKAEKEKKSQKVNKVINIVNKLKINIQNFKNKLQEKEALILNKKVVLGTIVASTVLVGTANIKPTVENINVKVTTETNDNNTDVINRVVKAGDARVVVDSTYEMSEEELKYKDIGTNDESNIVASNGLTVGIDSTFELTEEQKEARRLEEIKEQERKEAERREQEEYRLASKKQEIFNNPREINTLNDIFEAQEELESLGLTDEDKIYPDCPLSASLQWFIDGQARLRGLPTAFPISIVSTETRGQFNSSGVTAHNTNGTVDLGLSQQNSKYPVPSFAKKYNIDYNTAYLLIRDNDYVNMVCAFDTIAEIDRVKGNFQPTEYAGCYNGWLKWRNYETSRQYVTIFNEAYGKYAYAKVEPKVLTK